MSESMMLATSLKVDKELTKVSTKFNYPVQITEKLDGVPAVYTKLNGEIKVISRQSTDILSTPHIADFLSDILQEGDSITGELYIEGKRFKEISGLVRRSEPCYDLTLNVFEYCPAGLEDYCYQDRLMLMSAAIGVHLTPTTPVQLIGGTTVNNDEELLNEIRHFMAFNPDSEGLVIREWTGDNSKLQIGKRSKGMVKFKPKPTVDLRVVSFEEAVSKTGEPLGMVGRLNVEYKGTVIGVGAGKLKHKERAAIFQNQEEYIGKIAEVQYMRDPSYDALREPTFQQWREDKVTPNEEG